MLLLMIGAEPAQSAGRADDGGALLRVGTTGDYPPFTYREPATGRWVGYDIDLAHSLGKWLGRPVEFVPTTWKDLAADLEAGHFDIAMGGVSVTPERARRGVFSRPYLADGKAPVVRCADAFRFAAPSSIDRAGVRAVVNPGGTNERFARAHFSKAELRVHDDNLTIFDELLEGRADVMVTDAIEARMQQHLRPGLCAVNPKRPLERSQKAYLLRRDPAFSMEVDRWLRAELASGRAGRTLDAWLRYPWPLAPSAAVRLAKLVDERLALMPDVARYKWNRGLPIEDVSREQALLQATAAQASRHGLDPGRAVAFFAAQIEASKALQRELHFGWKANGLGSFASTPDLPNDIRPKIDALDRRLLSALAALDGRRERREFGALRSTALSAIAVELALSPVLR
jgi:chorismate mutase-like protein